MKYPNLKHTPTIALDLETKDPNLKKLGPGYHRSRLGLEDGRILCIAIATVDNQWWFDWNENTRQWLEDQSSYIHTIIGANIMYDLGWLGGYGGVSFGARFYDIQTMESLIDGGRSYYSLDKLAKQYLGRSKANDEIEEYATNMGWKGDARAHLWRIYEDDPSLVGHYAAQDTRDTFDVYQNQIPIIKKLDLEDVHNLESRLIPVLFRMRMQGVRIDTEKLTRTHEHVDTRITELESEINHIAGMEVNTAAPRSCAKAFDSLGIRYSKTDKGSPSITSDFLETVDHPIAEKIGEVRKLKKLQSTYLEGFEQFIAGGRVYTEFIPVRNGSRGTQTGRFSAQRPALQTIPSRGEGKKLARSLFLPEDGMQWEKQDQSQEEYRIFAHYARGGGAKELRHRYTTEPDMDMHTFARDFVGFAEDSNGRQLAKALNFLSLYNGGVHKFALQIGENELPPWPENQGYQAYLNHRQWLKENTRAGHLYFAYHDNLPCIKTTSKAAEKWAKNNGYARTFLKRRRYLKGREAYKALNTVIQGTGGEIMKLWLVQCEESGLWDRCPLHLTVHDETDFSNPGDEEASREIQRLGEQCLHLSVPLKVDRERGPNWADVEEI